MIYIHIPYCKQACHYCDFHFSTNFKTKPELINSIIKEINLRSNYLDDKNIKTIYFGGGTPSLLDKNDFERILLEIKKHFKINPTLEITVECNPDDITEEKILWFKTLGINRISIGIQTFDDGVLKWMNRSHGANEAKKALTLIQKHQFHNVTADLIYGIPNRNKETLLKDIQLLTSFGINHISAYHLTIEPKTYLDYLKQKNQLTEKSDSQSVEEYNIVVENLKLNGFEHYEVSNFAKNGFKSKHNSNYWSGKHYLGIGPGAHSFNGISRQWNISNNPNYIKNIETDNYYEIEILTTENQFNELLITSLRTKKGLDLLSIKNKFPKSFYENILETYKQKYSLNNDVFIENEMLFLSENGLFISDNIISEFMI